MKDTVVAQTRFLSDEMIALFEQTWVAIPNWKWIALVVAVMAGFALRPLLQYAMEKVKKASPWSKNHESFAAKLLSLNIEGPLSWIIVLLMWIAVIDNLALSIGLNKYLTLLAQVMLAFHFIRLLYLAAEAVGLTLAQLASHTDNKLDDILAPFVGKTLKFLAVILGVLIALQNFGVNVMALLAGLGIGGIAIALAAQDTAANVFGSITILFDQSFAQGDYIKIGDAEGTVEDIGFRSTKIRTPYNSLLTIPNSFVAKEKIDNMQARPRRRVRQILGLLYETPTAKIEEFCAEVKQALAADAKVDKKDILVSFMNFNASSLDVLMQFHLPGVTTYAEELEITQRLFKQVVDIAARVGVEFAYPTTTTYLKGLPSMEGPAGAKVTEISPPL